MILTSDSSWIRVANSPTDSGGVRSFIVIDGYGSGQHGYRDENDKYTDEVPAGDPLHGYVNWSFDSDRCPEVGAEFSVWLGEERGSYHERWVEVYAAAGKNPPKIELSYRHSGRPPKLIGSFIFSDIMDCCKKIIQLTGCSPPSEYDLSDAFPLEQEFHSVIKPDQANKPRPGETSAQYWKRITQEQLGKYPYRYEGD